MNAIEVLSSPLFQALGWTLIHFIWQGALIAILFACASVMLRRFTANARYMAACGAMFLMLAAPAATMFIISSSSPGSIVEERAAFAIQAAQPASAAGSTGPQWAADFVDTSDEAGPAPSPSSIKQWLAERLPAAMPWLLSLWFGGVLFLSLRFAGGLVMAQRLKRKETGASLELWREKVSALSLRLRVSRPVQLCESALVEVPTVIGWLRPVILVPVSALTGLSADQLVALLAHELAHVRRHDYLVNLLQTTIETLLFYHPAVWWVSAQVRQEREHCCDDLAVAACGDVLTYARALTALEQLRGAAPQLAVAANGGSLLVRIQRLLSRRAPARRGFENWLAGAVALATVVGLLAGAEIAFLSRNAKAAVKTDITMTAPVAESLISAQEAAPSSQPAKPSKVEAETSPTEEEASQPEDEPVGIEPTLPTPETPSPAETPVQEPTPPGSQDFISDMAAAGFPNLTVNQLIALKTHGVTPQFVRELAGIFSKKLTPDEVVAMKIHGVSTAFANQFKALGMNLDADEMVAFAVHGVTPKFIAEIKAAGCATTDPDLLVAYRIHGVTPAYIQEMKGLGFDGICGNELTAFRIHGVTPAFIQSMRSIIRGKLSADDLTGLRIHGVSPEMIKELEAIGYTNLTANQLMAFRIHGVTPAFISSIQAAGFKSITPNQLTELRIFGVTPEFITTVKSRGFSDVSLNQLIQLRRLNIIQSPKRTG
ncbi:MAG: M56 family metallopeptidase [Blastocatellia bacterium]